jgi:hypothetical protein
VTREAAEMAALPRKEDKENRNQYIAAGLRAAVSKYVDAELT